MMAHQVAIRSLQTDCQFKAEPARKDVMRHAVDHSCRNQLPAALERALDPVLDGHDGVIRIRALHLDMTSLDPLGGDLAQQMAGKLAAMIRGLLQKGRDGVYIWPDHAAFIAHYAMWRLGLTAGAEWAFADFAALTHLSPQHAAVEVLAARPIALLAIATDPAMRDAPNGFTRTLDDAHAQELLVRIATNTPHDPRQLIKTFGVIQAALCDHLPTPRVPLTAQGRLVLLLRLLADAKAADRDLDVAEIVVLIHILGGLSTLPDNTLTANGVDWQTRLATAAIDDLPQQTAGTLQALAMSPDGQVLMDRIAGIVVTNDNVSAAPATPDPDNTISPVSVVAACAGTALLIPSLIQLDPDNQLTDAQRHALMIATLPNDMQGIAALDPSLAQLFPVDPLDGALANWPAPSYRSGPADHLITATDGAALWAQTAMAHFTDRLTGLQGSSAKYLQDQFLTQSGDITTDPGHITVALHRVPLGIVLSMGGHLGHRGPIPWCNNRKLTIAIKGGV